VNDRFRQAIWQSRDIAEIALNATPAVNPQGAVLKLNIDATTLGLAQEDDRWTDQLGVFLALRDDAGLHSIVNGQSLRFRLKPGTYQRLLKDGIPIDQPIDANVKFESARILVVDENSGRMGSVTIPAAALRTKP
jgi:hypothetical protein